jgi:hypothetical protein
MESWVFDGTSSSYYELGAGWDTTVVDDGWWLDDIAIVGTVEQQVTPQPDTRPSSGGICSDSSLAAMPVSGCDDTVDDKGTVVSLKITDLDGTILDGTTLFATEGESIRVSAIDSQITGGCVNGIAEFQFYQGNKLVQDWTPKTYYLSAPLDPVVNSGVNAGYGARVRCSTAINCTSANIVSIDVPVYDGKGGDTIFGTAASPVDRSVGITYDIGTGQTCINTWAPGHKLHDLYVGWHPLAGKGWHLSKNGSLIFLGTDKLTHLTNPPPEWDGAHCIDTLVSTEASETPAGGSNGTVCFGGVGDPVLGVCSSGSLQTPLAGVCDIVTNVCGGGGTCTTGPSAGLPCLANNDCGVCAAPGPNVGSQCTTNRHCDTQLEGTFCANDPACGTGTCLSNPPPGKLIYFVAASRARGNVAKRLGTARLGAGLCKRNTDNEFLPCRSDPECDADPKPGDCQLTPDRVPTDGSFDAAPQTNPDCRDPWNPASKAFTNGFCDGGPGEGNPCNGPGTCGPGGVCRHGCAYCDE